VLDLSMPVLNGLEAARVLKRLLPSVPLLMFTNFDSGQLKREALAAGVSAVVSNSELAGLVHSIQFKHCSNPFPAFVFPTLSVARSVQPAHR
jgi:two-component system invasion response regulator UvrY